MAKALTLKQIIFITITYVIYFLIGVVLASYYKIIWTIYGDLIHALLASIFGLVYIVGGLL